MDIYRLILIVVIPAIVFFIVNVIILVTIRSSSNRVDAQPSMAIISSTNRTRYKRITRRDSHLLRHMIIMVAVFVGGWTPLYTLFAIQTQPLANSMLSDVFTLLCQLALLYDIIQLYVYNREIRRFLAKSIYRCFMRLKKLSPV